MFFLIWMLEAGKRASEQFVSVLDLNLEILLHGMVHYSCADRSVQPKGSRFDKIVHGLVHAVAIKPALCAH